MGFGNIPRVWYNMDVGSGVVCIYDVIGMDGWGEGLSPKSFREELGRVRGGHDELVLRINSPGGYIHDGFAIYNSLLGAGFSRIVVYVDGLAASCASFIAMCGDEIRVPEAAEMMVHNPWSISMGGSDAFRKEAAHLDGLREQIAGIYARRTGLGLEVVKGLMDAETWMDGRKAVELGFADVVEERSRVAACSFDLGMFGGVPESFVRLQDSLRDGNRKEAVMADVRDLVEGEVFASMPEVPEVVVEEAPKAEVVVEDVEVSGHQDDPGPEGEVGPVGEEAPKSEVEAPVVVDEGIERALAYYDRRHAELREELVSNDRCKFGVDELMSFDVDELEKMLEMCAPLVNYGAAVVESGMKACVIEPLPVCE